MEKKLLLFVGALGLGSVLAAHAVPYVGVSGGLITLSSGMTKMFDPLANLDGLDGKVFVGGLFGPSHRMQYGLEGAE